MKNKLLIKNLWIKIEEKEILKGVDLEIKRGEIHLLMGANGAGKTTLAQSLIGNQKFNVKCQMSRLASMRAKRANVKCQINGKDILGKSVAERARIGLFVSFQEPVAIPGVSFFSFLRTSYSSLYPKEKVTFSELKEEVRSVLNKVKLSEDFLQKSLNYELSGGEKKKFELVQFLIFRPKFAIFDEIDSGLDVDSLRLITQLIKEAAVKLNIGILFISHNPKIFQYIKFDFVHFLKEGKLKTTNNSELGYVNL